MRRRLIIAGIFLLAGAVVNVAVAWGLAVSVALHVMEPVVLATRTVPAFSSDSRSIQFDGWVLFQRSAPGCRMVAIVPEKSSSPRDSASPDVLPPGAAPAYRRLCAHTGRPVNQPPGTWNILVDQARGWPMPALCCQQEYNSYAARAGTTFVANGITITPGKGVLGQATALPLRPIWPGFAVNAMFYVVALWLVVCGPFVLRRIIRMRQGLCRACGYDLWYAEHDACPECGQLPSARS